MDENTGRKFISYEGSKLCEVVVSALSGAWVESGRSQKSE